MRRVTIPLLLLVWTLTLAIFSGQSLLRLSSATAQAPHAGPRWEYATLVLGDAAVDLNWQAGETSFTGPGDVNKPDLSRSVKVLYRQLGGQDQDPTLGMLLNIIGRNGWEMVSYAHPSGAQVWMFKRTNQ